MQLGSGSEQLADSLKEMFKEIRKYNYNPEAFTDLKVGRIDAVLVGYAYAVNQMKADPSFKIVGEPLAQAERCLHAVGGPVTRHVFTAEEGADGHCQTGNLAYSAAVSMDWLDELFDKA